MNPYLNDELDMACIEEELGVESLPDANALGCTFCSSSTSTASCPWSTAATLACASTLN